MPQSHSSHGIPACCNNCILTKFLPTCQNIAPEHILHVGREEDPPESPHEVNSTVCLFTDSHHLLKLKKDLYANVIEGDGKERFIELFGEMRMIYR